MTQSAITDVVGWNSTVQFDPAKTRQAAFHRAGAGDVTVPLMDRTGAMAYGAGPGYQAVALPYRGGAARMVVALPAATLPPQGFTSFLDPARFQQIVSGLDAGASGELQMPRFSLDSDASLLQPLGALGMSPAFRPDADFSGIASGLFITEVKHKVRLEVDEQGTTAAAATRVGMSLALRTPFRMVVDRPFLAAMQDTGTGTLLFAGVVADPA